MTGLGAGGVVTVGVAVGVAGGVVTVGVGVGVVVGGGVAVGVAVGVGVGVTTGGVVGGGVGAGLAPPPWRPLLAATYVEVLHVRGGRDGRAARSRRSTVWRRHGSRCALTVPTASGARHVPTPPGTSQVTVGRHRP